MKIQLGMLVQNEALKELVNQPMPSATAFRISMAVKAVQPHLEAFEEARTKMIEKYGTDGENGKEMKEDNKNWEKFVNEYNSLVNEEVDIKIKKVKASALSKVEIKPAHLMSLEWLIEE